MNYKRKEEIENLMEEMKREFMHGVACVMEYLAYQVSEEYGEKFSEEFFKNMEKSIDKTKR